MDRVNTIFTIFCKKIANSKARFIASLGKSIGIIIFE